MGQFKSSQFSLFYLCIALSAITLVHFSQLLSALSSSSLPASNNPPTKNPVADLVAHAQKSEDVQTKPRVTIVTKGKVPTNSMFYTLLGERYGTLNYSDIIETSGFSRHDDEQIARQLKAPCLLVGLNKKLVERWRDSHAPQCYVMLTADEKCRTEGAELRHYDYRDDGSIYVPIGTRYDTWEAFQEVMGNNTSIPFVKASQRSYVYNAMFSENTSPSRKTLSTVLRRPKLLRQNFTAFVQIASHWSIGEDNEHVLPRMYVSILLNSTFTLSPVGHNPECFRLYEALEAGSIPVIALDESYEEHDCLDALKRMRDFSAPFVWLSSWNELPQRLSELVANPVALDLQQAQMMEWYQAFMRSRFQEIEKALLTPREGSALEILSKL